MIPYGVYAIAPKQLPIWPLQTPTNRVLKGGTKHRHMTNALTQHPTIGEQHPNIHQDMPLLVLAELHRLLNTPNLAQRVLIAYLRAVQLDHNWPHHPLDPATLHLSLNAKWDHSLIHVWRQWLQIPSKAVKPAFLNTSKELNPGGWTNFFTSTRFDYHTARVNRTPWILPEPLRHKLAIRHIFNWTQLQSYPKQNLLGCLSITDIQAIRLHIQAHPERGMEPTNPELPNPWKTHIIHPILPLAPSTYTAGDGAADQYYMSAAWAAATPTQFQHGTIPIPQQVAQPVFGYINSTWAETYALEGALISAVQNKLSPTMTVHSQQPDPDKVLPNHVQDNKSTVDTFHKYMSRYKFTKGER
jgi:hypothetical protein